MDYGKILKRAWSLLWSYRTLWIFGVLLALTGSGSGGNGGNGIRYNNPRGFDGPRWDFGPGMRGLERFFERIFSPEMMSAWIAVAIAVVCLAVAIGVLRAIVHYVSQTALIGMVDEHERSGERVGFRQGWRLGWNRAAWRLFLIDLLLYLPVIALVLGLLGCGALFFFTSGVMDGRDPGVGWIVPLVGGGMVFVLMMLVVSVAVSLVQPVIRRYAVLENTGVLDGLRGGFGLLRRRLVDVFLMWLILVGLTIAYTIALIPAALILLAVGALLGGGLGVVTYFALQAAAGETAAIVSGVLVGLPIFLVLFGIPMVFVEGLRQVYGSTTWTLAYRELTIPPAVAALESLPVTPAPAEGAAEVF